MSCLWSILPPMFSLPVSPSRSGKFRHSLPCAGKPLGFTSRHSLGPTCRQRRTRWSSEGTRYRPSPSVHPRESRGWYPVFIPILNPPPLSSETLLPWSPKIVVLRVSVKPDLRLPTGDTGSSGGHSDSKRYDLLGSYLLMIRLVLPGPGKSPRA